MGSQSQEARLSNFHFHKHLSASKPLYLLFSMPEILFSAAASAAKSLQSCPTLCNPIDGSPPGSPRPWDSPGKNTGVGCHFLLQCMTVKSESRVRLLSHGLQPTRLLHPWDFPGKSTGVGCHCLLCLASLGCPTWGIPLHNIGSINS